jgi:hypothetical protein
MLKTKPIISRKKQVYLLKSKTKASAVKETKIELSYGDLGDLLLDYVGTVIILAI